MSLKSLVTTVTELCIEWSHAVIKKGKISQMPIPRAIEASFAQSAESAILDYIIFNMKISGFLHPTVTSDRRISASRGPILLRFGQEVPLEVLLTSSESQVTRHYR